MTKGGAAPRIYLHIGRNKAGSTSLQDFFLDRREALAAAGLRYCLFGHLKDSVPGVLGFATQFDLADHARTGAERAYLVSNEFLFGWPREYTDSMVDGLAGFDVRVIAYIRPYGAWVRSAYAEDVKWGLNRRDFDQYLDVLAPRISAWPYLEGWGEALGWDRLRVRSTDPQDLTGGDLIGDCLTALSLDPDLASGAKRSNRAPDWPVLEMLRALIETDDETGWDAVGHRAARSLQALLEDCLTESEPPATEYLTVEQARWLADLYNGDLDHLARRTGVTLRREQPSGSGRAALPCFELIPDSVRRRWAERAATPEFHRAHPEAAAAVERLRARRGVSP
jgi:hypothetical protein